MLFNDAVTESLRIVPDNEEKIKLSFAPLVDAAAPAVVNIYARKLIRERVTSPLFADPLFRRFFGDSVPLDFGTRERLENSLGSGVIVRADGIVVTNHHVIKGAQEITVVLADRRELDANIIVGDERTDIAVLRVNNDSPLPHLELADADSLKVGDLVLAIGNPFGVGQTVTSGIVSALARTMLGITDFRFFIQTDAAINPGNSGGALIDMHGQLVGVNTAIFSPSGGSLGIGFAIPSSMVRSVVNSAVEGKPLVRPWLGFIGRDVSAEIAEALDMPRPIGTLIKSVFERGPAADVPLHAGDVILAVDGKEIEDNQALRFRLATRAVGESDVFTVLRDGQFKEFDFELIAPPEDPPRNITLLQGRHPLSGARVANLSPALAEELGVESELSGVIVLEMVRGSPAAHVSLRPGDVIRAINGRDIKTLDDIEGVIATAPQRWRLLLRRGNRKIVLDIG